MGDPLLRRAHCGDANFGADIPSPATVAGLRFCRAENNSEGEAVEDAAGVDGEDIIGDALRSLRALAATSTSSAIDGCRTVRVPPVADTVADESIVCDCAGTGDAVGVGRRSLCLKLRIANNRLSLLRCATGRPTLS